MKADEPRTAGHAISRMPKKVRDAISCGIEDGADWKAIRKITDEAGFVGLRPQNVTNYRKKGHKEWLAKEERIESIRRDSEATAEIVRHYAEHGGSPAEAGLLTAAEMMRAAIGSLGPEAMKVLLADDPKAVFSMVRELARVTESLRKPLEVKAVENAEPVRVMSAEERARALKEIFGLPG